MTTGLTAENKHARQQAPQFSCFSHSRMTADGGE